MSRIDTAKALAAAAKDKADRASAKSLSIPAAVPWGVQRVNAQAAWKKTKGDVAICVVGQDAGIAAIIASVAPEARFYDAEALGPQGAPRPPAAIAAGIRRCSEKGFRLINVVGIDNEDPDGILKKAVDSADAKGALIVAPASAGPFSRGTGLAYPARYAKVVAVSGSTASDELLPEGNGSGNRYGFFSGSGRSMSFIAPGSDVLTNLAGGFSAKVSGSNAAAAYVTGLAALYISLHPDASPDAIKQALGNSAAPLKGLTVEQQGRGMIDAGKLVTP